MTSKTSSSCELLVTTWIVLAHVNKGREKHLWINLEHTDYYHGWHEGDLWIDLVRLQLQPHLPGFPVSKSSQRPLTILKGAEGADRRPVRALLAGRTDTTFLEVSMFIEMIVSGDAQDMQILPGWLSGGAKQLLFLRLGKRAQGSLEGVIVRLK